MASEFNEPKEEFTEPGEMTPLYGEFEHGTPSSEEESASLLSKMKKMAYLVAACGSVAGLGFGLTTVTGSTTVEETVDNVIMEGAMVDPEISEETVLEGLVLNELESDVSGLDLSVSENK